MKKLNHLIIILLAAIICDKSNAVEVNLVNQDQQVRLEVGGLLLPEKLLAAELNSGLPNTVTVIVKIYSDDKMLDKRIINSTIIYDLWDELYRVQTIHSGGIVARQFTSQPKLIQSLKNVVLDDFLFTLAKKHSLNVVTKESVTLKIQTVYNPIDQEKIRKIQKWIMSSRGFANSGDFQVALDNQSESTIRGSNGLRFQKLFEKLVEDYAPDEGFSAQWISELHSVSLKLNDSKKKNSDDE